MKRLFTIAVMALFAISCTNKNRVYSDNDMSDVDLSVSKLLTEIEVAGPIKLKLTNTMSEKSFNITAPAEIYSMIDVSTSGDCLKIEFDGNADDLESDIVVTANLDQYESVTANMGANVIVVGSGEFDKYNVTLDEATFEGDISCYSLLTLDMTDASSAYISGSTNICTVSLARASTFDGANFSCQKLNATLSEASSVDAILVYYYVAGDLSDYSTLRYTGSASEGVTVDEYSAVEKY